MTGSTRTCISLLNAFSVVSVLLGALAIYAAVSAAEGSTTIAMARDVSSGLGLIVVATLLRAASEALRLLSVISESVKPAPTAVHGEKKRVVQARVA